MGLKVRRRFLVIAVFLLLFAFCSFSFSEEEETFVISFHKMVYFIIPHRDLGEVHFITHLPVITKDSIPLFIRLSEEENYNAKVTGFNFKKVRENEDQNLIRFTLKNCAKDEKVYIVFEVYALKKFSNYSDMPKAVSLSSYSNLSDELKYYLQPSSAVQSDAEQIRKKAFDILYGNWEGNVIEILKDIIRFTGNEIKYEGGMQTALDALTEGHAVCTGKANLAVALCRALGIPARVLFGDTTHYIVEIWIPNYGWVRGESTQGIFPYPKHLYTVCWIANIDDENYGGERGGVIAYWGFEDIDWSDAYWDFSYPEAKGDEEFATVKGRKDSVDALFEKGKEVWRLFCQLKNAGLIEDDSNLFSQYQKLYFEALLDNDIQGALQYADEAISEENTF